MQNETPHFLGHRERVKAKFMQSGFKAFSDYEILELALFYAIPRRDVKPLAKSLIEMFGSLKQVFDADPSELQKAGLKENAAVFFSFVREFSKIYSYLKIKEGSSLSSPQDAVSFLSGVLSSQKTEKLCAVFLTAGNRVIDYREIEEGTVNKSVVIPRKIAEFALQFKASAAIMAHNHPGGNMTPSQCDIDATICVRNSLSAIDVALLDHIIISANSYFSFKEQNLL